MTKNLAHYISATYQGHTYRCDQPARSFTPTFYGLKQMNDYLIFGELDATKTYDQEEIILSWSYLAAPDTIVFSHSVTMKDGKTQINESFRLNGKDIEGQMILYKSFSSPGKLYTDDIDISAITQLKEQNKKINTFGLQLFQKMMASSENKQGSTLASPFGVACLLAMIADGALPYSLTREEILKALSFRENENYREHSKMDVLFNVLIDYMRTMNLTMSSAFICQKDVPCYAGYAEHLANIYRADYALLDFASPEALQTINAWSNEKTLGKIPQILNHIDPMDVAYYLNSVFFSSSWLTEFPEQNIYHQYFTCKDGTKKIVTMMHQDLNMGYDENDTFTAVTADLQPPTGFQISFLLPKQGKTLEDVIQALINHPSSIVNHQSSISLSLPQFRIESNHMQLIEQLQDLGIKTAFTSSANLIYIWPQANLSVSKLIQKTTIEVNRQGCTATATGGEASGFNGSVPDDSEPVTNDYQIPFTCNRPFVFLIRERNTDLNLFIGTYCGD
jgi:serpin B